MGYRARYCAPRCKARVQRRRTPETFRAARKRSYKRIVLDDERYAKHLKSNRRSVQRIRLWLSEFKMKSGCVDCGFKQHPAALQLDHEGTKTAHIADLRSSVARLMAEITSGKCVVRCANCHSVRTWALKNGLKYTHGMSHQIP